MRLMLTVTYIQWNCHPRSSSSNEVESRNPERYSSAAPLSRLCLSVLISLTTS
ncbi:unnamed protein product [Linum tenue]|uniref:Uncharacterized protein n=1 Tax=Linum tenue TaxID=586396 RepID=A0AAV0K559_9ROSI|nr:unnamed protein product [Linum tenue]